MLILPQPLTASKDAKDSGAPCVSMLKGLTSTISRHDSKPVAQMLLAVPSQSVSIGRPSGGTLGVKANKDTAKGVRVPISCADVLGS